MVFTRRSFVAVAALATIAMARPASAAYTLSVADPSPGVATDNGFFLAPSPYNYNFSPDSANPTSASSFDDQFFGSATASLSDPVTYTRTFNFAAGGALFSGGEAFTADSADSTGADFISFIIGGTAGETGPVNLTVGSDVSEVISELLPSTKGYGSNADPFSGFTQSVMINGVTTEVDSNTTQSFTLNVGDTFGYEASLFNTGNALRHDNPQPGNRRAERPRARQPAAPRHRPPAVGGSSPTPRLTGYGP